MAKASVLHFILQQITCMPRWALADARDRGVAVADDIGFDSSGQVTIDPGRILNGGAIQVFDRCSFWCSTHGAHASLATLHAC